MSGNLLADLVRISGASERDELRGRSPRPGPGSVRILARASSGEVGRPTVNLTPSAVTTSSAIDVLFRLAGHHRMHAARVVADHAAERAAAVRRRIGAEREVVGLARVGEDRRARRPAGRARCAGRDRSRGCAPCIARSRAPRRRCSIVRRGCPRAARQSTGAPFAGRPRRCDDVLCVTGNTTPIGTCR